MKKNWRTSLWGIVTIVLVVLKSTFITKQFAPEDITTITGAFGLVVAADSKKEND